MTGGGRGESETELISGELTMKISEVFESEEKLRHYYSLQGICFS